MKLRTLVGLLWAIAIPVYLLWERQTGEAAWDQTQAAYTAAGESFDQSLRFADEVPRRRNFGAIPELRGITRQDEVGEEIRTSLELLGLRHPSEPHPKSGRRKPHQAYAKLDLGAYHAYFHRTGLLPVNPEAEDLAADLLAVIEQEHGAAFSALLAARGRRHAIFVPALSKVYPDGSLALSQKIPQLQTAQRLCQGLKLLAILNLRTGDPERAAQCIETMLRLSEATAADGKTLISHLVSIATSMLAQHTLWEGLEARVWNDAQLESLQKRISAFNWRAAAADAMRAELLTQIDLYEHLEVDPNLAKQDLGLEGTSIPPFVLDGMLKHNRATTVNHLHTYAIAPLASDIDYLGVKRISERSEEILSRTPAWNPRTILARLATPAVLSSIKRSAEMDASSALAVTACALERYFLQHETYPDSLEPLVPQLLQEVPRDPMDKQPMRYKKTADSRYQLHSVGWDGDDDGGEDGDITWDYQSERPPARKKP